MADKKGYFVSSIVPVLKEEPKASGTNKDQDKKLPQGIPANQPAELANKKIKQRTKIIPDGSHFC